MTTYDYLVNNIGEEQLQKLVKMGVVPVKVLTYMQIYKYHMANGRCRTKTSAQFKMPSPTIGYALQQMKREI